MNTKRFLYSFSIIFILLGLFLEPFSTLIMNFTSLIIGSDSLIADYFIKGSIGTAFLNAGLVGLIGTVLMDVSEAPFNGGNIPSVMLAIGFSLFGKNIFNIWPILLGGVLYSKIHKVALKNVIPTSLLAIGMAPFVSEIAFRFGLSFYISIPLSFAVGIIMGYLIFPIKDFTYAVHKRYIVYNMGLATGLLGLLVYAIFQSLGYKVEAQLLWSETFDPFLYLLFAIIFIGYTLIGLFQDKGLKNYFKLLKDTGYNIDFVEVYGENAVFINIGLTSLMALLISFVLKFPLNGPVLGSIITLAGFSAYEEHILNVLPLFIGVFIGSLIFTWNMSEPAPMITLLLMAGFAPLVGSYGFILGIIAGLLTSTIARLTGSLHGGLVLYNTGLAVGISAIILQPIYEVLFKNRNSKKESV